MLQNNAGSRYEVHNSELGQATLVNECINMHDIARVDPGECYSTPLYQSRNSLYFTTLNRYRNGTQKSMQTGRNDSL